MDSDASVDTNEDSKPSSEDSSSSPTQELTYTIPMSQIGNHMESLIHKASRRLSVPSNVAAVILRNKKWDMNILPAVNDIRQPTDSNKGVYARCGARQSSSTMPTPLPVRNNNGPRECTICYNDEIAPSEMFSMPCGHEYCRSCWETYIQTSMERFGPSCVYSMTCPHDGCSELVTEEEVKKIHPSSFPSFRNYQIQSFVTASDGLRFCRGPDCSMTLRLDPTARTAKPCSSSRDKFATTCFECQTVFCIGCGEENHHPVDCNMFCRWVNDTSQVCLFL